MATIQVKATLRDAGTKGHARRLRMAQRIPAVLYGAGESNLPVALEGPSFELMLRRISSGNQLLDLEVAGAQPPEYKVLIKEVQRSPLDGKILHVDLQHVSMTHKIRVHVPIHLNGIPAGVKEGGILEHLLREVEVECLPDEIPSEFVVDVSALLRGQSIHVRDIAAAGTHLHESPERVVATVVGKTKEEEPVAAAAPAEGEAAAPAAEAAPAKAGAPAKAAAPAAKAGAPAAKAGAPAAKGAPAKGAPPK